MTLELRDGVPVITLAVEVPAEDLTGEWSVLNRLMMLVVDGPGDAGFLCRRLGPEGDLAPAGWDEAFDRPRAPTWSSAQPLTPPPSSPAPPTDPMVAAKPPRATPWQSRRVAPAKGCFLGGAAAGSSRQGRPIGE
ncbi:hypothetical protein ACFQX7_18875 [Luedemannella flava]